MLLRVKALKITTLLAAVIAFDLFVIWAVAPVVAWRVWRSSRQKHGAHPGA